MLRGTCELTYVLGYMGQCLPVLSFPRAYDHHRRCHAVFRCVLRGIVESRLFARLGMPLPTVVWICTDNLIQVLVIECVCVTIAMYCLIQFYVQIKDDIHQHSPFLKILSIKLVIFLCFWQSVSLQQCSINFSWLTLQTLISFLFSSGAIKSTETIQTNDLKVGIPNLLITIEMALFAILHLWAFAWQPYAAGRSPGDEVTDFYGNGKAVYYGGPFGVKAILDALNPLDLIKAVSRGLRWLFVGRKKRMLDPSYQVDNEAIGLKPTDPTDSADTTAYKDAGPMISGGRSGRRNRSPDEEDAVLLGHPQPNPMAHSSGNLGIAPSPEPDELEHDGHEHERIYSSNRLSTSSLLEPKSSHSPRPYSPYDHERSHSPYSMPSDEQETGLTTTSQFRRDSLQEQVPMPMPEAGAYRPPPLYDDDYDDYERRGRTS